MNVTNLIRPRTIYYHRQLRVYPPQPISYVNSEGKIVREGITNLDIRIKKNYTDDDLNGYFMDTFDINLYREEDIVRYRKQLIYLVERHGLDAILFTIDAVKCLIVETNQLPPKMPFNIEEYIIEGTDLMYEKKALEDSEGIKVAVD